MNFPGGERNQFEERFCISMRYPALESSHELIISEPVTIKFFSSIRTRCTEYFNFSKPTRRPTRLSCEAEKCQAMIRLPRTKTLRLGVAGCDLENF